MKTNLLPIRDFKLAIVHAAVWMFAFWQVEYPTDDWGVTAVILYVSLWLSREVVLTLLRSAGKRLQGYAKRVALKAGIELRKDAPAENGFRDKLFIGVSYLLVCSTFIGLSLIVGVPMVSIYGITPLPFYFSWVAWGLFLVGGLGVFLMFGLVVWWLSSVEAGIESARQVANRQPTELELRLLFLPLLFLFLAIESSFIAKTKL